MRVLVSALLLCLPVTLFAMEMDSANVKADQSATNVVMNDDLNQADELNLEEGASDAHRRGGWGRGGWGRGWGRGYGYGGWGYGGYGLGWAYPYYGYSSWLYPYYGYGWAW